MTVRAEREKDWETISRGGATEAAITRRPLHVGYFLH